MARGLFHKAIGESGAYFGAGPLGPQTLPASEQSGVKFASALGANSIAALRGKPAEEVLKAALKTQPWFSPTIDGYFLPEEVEKIFAAGKQARVPLLAGWNADEVRSGVVLAKQKATAQSFTEETRKRYGQDADAILKAYPATSDPEALESAASLASDMFIGYGTWKWIETHARTGGAPVYRFSFDRKIPVPAGETVNGMPATSRDIGARHAGEIEYVFGSLDSREGRAMGADRSHAVGRDDQLLGGLRQDWRAEGSGTPRVAALRSRQGTGPAPRRKDHSQAGHAAPALRSARCLHGATSVG